LATLNALNHWRHTGMFLGLTLYWLTTFSMPGFGGDLPETSRSIEGQWQQTLSAAEYQAYFARVAQDGSVLHHDEMERCYARDFGHVGAARGGGHGAVNDSFGDLATCLSHAYTGRRLRAPPFFPFALRITGSPDSAPAG
jgi:hypothetical protein